MHFSTLLFSLASSQSSIDIFNDDKCVNLLSKNPTSSCFPFQVPKWVKVVMKATCNNDSSAFDFCANYETNKDKCSLCTISNIKIPNGQCFSVPSMPEVYVRSDCFIPRNTSSITNNTTQISNEKAIEEQQHPNQVNPAAVGGIIGAILAFVLLGCYLVYSITNANPHSTPPKDHSHNFEKSGGICDAKISSPYENQVYSDHNPGDPYEKIHFSISPQHGGYVRHLDILDYCNQPEEGG